MGSLQLPSYAYEHFLCKDILICSLAFELCPVSDQDKANLSIFYIKIWFTPFGGILYKRTWKRKPLPFAWLPSLLSVLEPTPLGLQYRLKTSNSPEIFPHSSTRCGTGGHLVLWNGLNNYWIFGLFIWRQPLLNYPEHSLSATLISHMCVCHYISSVPLENPD